jgi:hypothetical protein
LVQLVDVVERREEQVAKAAAEEADRKTALELNRQLVQEQDMEYQQALRADSELAERKAREKQEEEKGLQEIEKQKKLKSQELEAEAKKEERRRQRRQLKLERVGPEPEVGVEVITVRVRLPNGDKVQRKFLKKDQLLKVFHWIEGQELKGIEGFALELPPGVDEVGAGKYYYVVTTHPRNVYDDGAVNLATLGGGGVMLIVEEAQDEGDEGDEGDEADEDER